MKYHTPTQGSYESGLTAKLMYNLVDSLIKKHITQEDIKRTDEKYNAHSPEKLWEKPEITGELEEFVMSYLIDDLQPPLPGFEQIFTRDETHSSVEENLADYLGKLKQHYGTMTEAHNAFSELSNKIRKRGEKLYEECHNIHSLKKGKELIKVNAEDAFGHIWFLYHSIKSIIDDFGVQPQS